MVKKEDRSKLLAEVWGGRKLARLNKVIGTGYCGKLTVREFAALVLADNVNFKKGLDTPICIGDFEGNFCADILSISIGGDNNDHICIMGDPHQLCRVS